MRLPTPRRAWRRARWLYASATEGRGGTSRGQESDAATAYWASLRSYHRSNDAGRENLERSRWVSQLVDELDLESILEVGTNSGRNLQVIRERHRAVRLAGIDVNPRAIEFARSKRLDIDFRVADANAWTEDPAAWDAILTMSVLDHIPDETIDALAANIAMSARRYVIAVELWDGSSGTRGQFKYSRNTRDLFERQGLTTIHWQPSVGQYDTATSPMWSYVGSRRSRAPL